MRRISVRLVAILALILAGLMTMILFNRKSLDEENQKQESRSLTDSLRHGETLQGGRSSPKSVGPMATLDSRAQRLIDLKKRWLRIGERPPGENSSEDLIYRDDLSKESARVLLCSSEAIELVQFLEKEQIHNSVETEIKALFGSMLAAEARQMLVSLPQVASSNGINYREMWSSPAGKGCPPEQFAEFCTALRDPGCIQEAVFGHNIALAQIDPVGALNSTLDQIQRGAESRTKNSSLKNLIQALPSGTDFEQVDKLLPASEPDDPLSPFRGIKLNLVQAWSKSDPTAATNYVMAHPEKYPVSCINQPVMEVLTRDLTTGIEWIQTFPDGPYFDAAAGIAVARLQERGNSKEACELAAQIGNPTTRRETMAAALKPFKVSDH